MKTGESSVNIKKFYRNLITARLILIFSFFSLIVLFYIEKNCYKSIYISFLTFIMEAVLIASIADGVAIFALTKRVRIGNYSLKFTGLIQNKREALISGIVEAFRKKFFPKERVIKTVQELKIVESLKTIIEENINEENAEVIGKAISKIIKKNKEKISEIILKELEKYLLGVNSVKVAQRIYSWSKSNNLQHELIAEIFDRLYSYAKSSSFKELIEEKLKESEVKNKKGFWSVLKYGAAKITNILNYSELAAELQKSVVVMLQNIREEEDGKRWQNMEEEVSELIKRLSENKEFSEELEQVKSDIIINLVRPFLIKSIAMIAVWLEDGKIEKREVEELLSKYGINVKVEFETINVVLLLNSAMQKGVEELRKSDKAVQSSYEKLIARVIENEYEELTTIIQEVLSKLTDDGIVTKINEVVGSNIQWLRISGAYVGAVTGAVIFLVIKFPVLFLPFFVAVVTLLLLSKRLRKRLVIYSD